MKGAREGDDANHFEELRTSGKLAAGEGKVGMMVLRGFLRARRKERETVKNEKADFPRPRPQRESFTRIDRRERRIFAVVTVGFIL